MSLQTTHSVLQAPLSQELPHLPLILLQLILRWLDLDLEVMPAVSVSTSGQHPFSQQEQKEC